MNRWPGMVAPFFRFDRAPGVTEWAERNLVIPREMSPRSPGPFSTDGRPWAREMLEPWHPESGVEKFDAAAGVQIFKTTAIAIGVGYRMVHAPVPVMIVGGSSTDFAKREISKKRLHPLINENEVLRRLKPHDANLFGLTEMMMAFAPILVTGAGSDTNLAGSTQGIVAIDEAAKIVQESNTQAQEAHPIRLAEDRTKDFLGSRFLFKCSTPNSPTHLFWQDVQAGSFRHLFVPCPHCGDFFPFEFESRKGTEVASAAQLGETMDDAKPTEYRSVVWSPAARNADGTWDEEKVRETTRYICPHNGCEIKDEHKPAMLRAYEAKDLNPKAPKSHRSIRIPSIYSPQRRFSDWAMGFLNRGDLFSTGLQVFFNHELAKPWSDIDLRLKDEEIWSCKAEGDIAYVRGMLPAKKGILYAGADIGQAASHWVVALVDFEGNIWVIDWGTVLSLDDLLKERLKWVYHRAGKPEAKLRPMVGLVDSGDFTSEVYKMCQRSGRFWWPSKGSNAGSGEWSQTKLAAYQGLTLYTYVDKVAKDELYDLRIQRKQGRRLFLPADVTSDLIDGLRGQERINKGIRAQWKDVREDHYGDAIKLVQTISWVFSNERIPQAPDR